MDCWRFRTSFRINVNSSAGSSLGIVISIIGSIWAFIAVWLILISEEERIADSTLLYLQASKNSIFAANICAAEVSDVIKNDKIATFNSDFYHNSQNNDWLGIFDNSSGLFLGWFVSGNFAKTTLNIDKVCDTERIEQIDCDNVAESSFSYKATDLGIRPLVCNIEPHFLHSNTVDGGQKIDFLNNIRVAENDFQFIGKFLKQISKDELKPNAEIGIYPVVIQGAVRIRFALNSSGEITPYLSVAFVLWNPYSKPISKNNYCLEVNLEEDASTSQKTPELKISKTADNCAQFLCGKDCVLAKIAINDSFESGEIKCITFNTKQPCLTEINNGVEDDGINELEWPVVFKRTMDLKCNFGDTLKIDLPKTRISFSIKDLAKKSVFQKLSFNFPELTKNIKIGQNDSFCFFYDINLPKQDNIELVQLRSSNINIESENNENYSSAIDAFGLSDFFDKTDSTKNNKDFQLPWELSILDNIPAFDCKKKQFEKNSKIKEKPLYCVCDNNKNFLTKLNAFPPKLDNQSMPAFWLGEGRKVSPHASDSIAELNRIFWNKYFYKCDSQQNSINVHSSNVSSWTKILYEFFEKNNYYCHANALNDIAKTLIAEIKKRGPFKSISDFFIDNSKKTPGCFQKVLTKYENLPKRLSQVKFAETVGHYLHSRSDSFLIYSTSSLTKNKNTISKESKILLQRKIVSKNDKTVVAINKIFIPLKPKR